MKESLTIKSFGPIDELKITDISPLTVFIGESGSGKSTIMKVLAMFRWIYKKMNMWSYLHSSGMQKPPIEFNFGEMLVRTGMEGYLSSNTHITYIRDGYSIVFDNGTLDTENALIDTKDLSIDKLSFISDKRSMIPDMLSTKTKEASGNFYLNETYSDFLEASKSMEALEVPYLSVKLNRKKETTGIEYFIENSDNSRKYSLHFEDSSSGMQNTIPMEYLLEYYTRHYDILSAFNKALLSYAINSDSFKDFRATQNAGDIKNRNIYIHIEEPELSLYPDMQVEFMKHLLQNCFHTGNVDNIDFFLSLTTHSPYIVNYLNLAIRQGLIRYEDVDVFWVHDGFIERLNRDTEQIIDTRILSDTIAEIYRAYNEIQV